MNNVRLWRDLKFLSTPSARRATRLHVSESLRNADFYPRPLRGGRRLDAFGLMDVFKISIHALCEEGDPRPQRLRGHQRAISIHALCEEGDAQNRQRFYAFN